MKTILITGGTDGMGRGLAMHYLRRGDSVVVVGHSQGKGDRFLAEAAAMGAKKRATYIRADLSLVSENRRVIKEVRAKHDSLDSIVLAAASLRQAKETKVTGEGFEFLFALMYVSRYILSYGLTDLLEKSPSPVILNIAAPGMKGDVDWNAVEHQGNGGSGKAQFQSSRLNDLLGVAFAERQKQSGGKIRYVLFNPWAVRSNGALNSFDSPVMKLVTRAIYAVVGQSVEEAIVPMARLIDNPPQAALSAFIKTKPVDLTMPTFDKAKARRLNETTRRLMNE